MKSLKNRLLFLFSIVFFLLVIIVISFFVHDNKIDKVLECQERLSGINYLLTKSKAIQNDFFLQGALSSGHTGKSDKYKNQYTKVQAVIHEKLDSLTTSPLCKNIVLQANFKELRRNIERQDSLFTRLVTGICQKKPLNPGKKEAAAPETNGNLTRYQESMKTRARLNKLFAKINRDIEKTKLQFSRLEARSSKRVKNISFLALIIAAGDTILVFYLLLQKLGKPIKKLTRSIQDIIQSDFAVNKSIPLIKSKDEMGQLSYHFKEMYHKIQQRTRQLEQNAKEIAAQRDKIVKNQEIVNASEERIRSANLKILEQQENITDSIHYAKRIQQAVLPRGSYIKKCIPKYFILYLPKDIVSGDFYWVTRKANTVMIAAADCTGHGVPGAFMSMLGISFLNDILRKNMKKFFESRLKASDFLEELRKKVKKALGRGKEDSVMKDGMDITFCIIDLDNNMMQYAGAFNPLIIIRDNELIKVKATRNPIGSYIWETAFENHELQLHSGDRLYMFSDGFIDQFGGKDNKKFKNKPFEKLLLGIHQKPMAEQHDILEKTLEDWRGDNEQVDDVLVCGFLIP